MPFHEGIRRPHELRGTAKAFNENLAPLRRYLERQVGRPWSKIFAEIAARLSVGSTVQQHVRDHIKDFVAVTPRRGIDVYGRRCRNGLWPQALYVDPRDGLLKRTADLPELRRARRAASNQVTGAAPRAPGRSP